jgi:glyoxylase-like metal-dependent hydrolase (beta-lactamase superfamily II)/rhodanese-related sulfurtransferase
MYFEALRTDRGCMSYLVGCEKSSAAIVIDPADELIDRYLASSGAHGLRIRYLLDTHTHADHFSALRELRDKLDAPTAMHRESPAPFVDIRLEDGETLIVGDLRLGILHTPGHTRDSICVLLPGRVCTGDTLLLGGTGRTDLPTGDPNALYDSLFGHLLLQDSDLVVLPAHNYKGLEPTTLGEQIRQNPRLQKRDRGDFVEQMRNLDLSMPDHLTEALRTNCSGGLTVDQLIQHAAERISFMSMEELQRRIVAGDQSVEILDVREADAYAAGHIPGARHLARGQLELKIDELYQDPGVRILVYCEFGRISTLAAGTLHAMGFRSAIALDGGIRGWQEAGYPIEA